MDKMFKGEVIADECRQLGARDEVDVKIEVKMNVEGEEHIVDGIAILGVLVREDDHSVMVAGAWSRDLLFTATISTVRAIFRTAEQFGMEEKMKELFLLMAMTGGEGMEDDKS